MPKQQTLWETIKKPFLVSKDDSELSSKVDKPNVLDQLDDSGDIYTYTAAFFDATKLDTYMGLTDDFVLDLITNQKDKIMQYRRLAKNPDVDDAIEEIVNETINILDDKNPLGVDFNEENKKLQDAITKSWNKVNKLINTKKNIYSIVRKGYIDGQFIFHLGYKEGSVKEGIQSIQMIDPCNFYYDKKIEKYKYKISEVASQALQDPKKEYSKEEIVLGDFDLREDGINLSYLEKAMKTANQLSTLEDLLIPLRFSRSISRRVFNVDVGELAPKKAEEAMNLYQQKFKYKKFYNAQTGEVSNQQHITSMVEDYWFSNRSGGKGTEVSVLDESGNLGELDDILYFYKKLYKNMKIPSNRIPNSENADFDFNATSVSKEDIKFFMFINRIRSVITTIYKEILKREVVSTEIMSETEWDEYEEKLSIYFINSNKFIEKMELDDFMMKLDNFTNALQNKQFFGINRIIKDIFGYSDKEIIDMLKEVQKEKASKEFKEFYIEPEF